MTRKLLTVLTLAITSQIASAKILNEINPAEMLRNVAAMYEHARHDPLLKAGHIDDFLREKEFMMLSPSDKKALEKSILANNFEGGIKWTLKGTVLTIDNPPGFKTGKKLAIDFRDMKTVGSFPIYLNGSKFEMLKLGGLAPGQSDIVGQLDDIEQFIAVKGLQSYFPSLNDSQGLFTLRAIQAGLLPFAILQACDTKTILIGAVIAIGGYLLFQHFTKKESTSSDSNNNHH